MFKFATVYIDYELKNEHGGFIQVAGWNKIEFNKDDKLYVYNGLLMLETNNHKRLFPTYNVKEIQLNKESPEKAEAKEKSITYEKDN